MFVLTTLAIGTFTYVLATLLGYVIHWAIHQRWAGKAYQAHLMHHAKLYPPWDLSSDTYRSAGSNSTVWTFVLAFSPLLLLPVLLSAFGVLSFMNTAAIVLAIILVGVLNDVIHDSYHVNDHWVSRVIPGYASLREFHFIHHRNVKKNFGIYSMIWDRMFRTFRNK
jgi:sterol desaturase/sphingolipid hydroxylase (fatty acid hydroxylase superfamily)